MQLKNYVENVDIGKDLIKLKIKYIKKALY